MRNRGSATGSAAGAKPIGLRRGSPVLTGPPICEPPVPIAGSDGRGPRGSPMREGSKDADGPSAAESVRPENTLRGFHRVIGG